jgi:predicted hotdog family 3-hydroxylacyl-ACP dehydratase
LVKEEMNYRELKISDLIPQQPPFVMVDCMTDFDEKHTETELTIREENIFYENGSFTASGLIENIAQTCAARMGYINRFIAKENVKLGFIGSIRNLHVLRRPVAGEKLATAIEIIEEVFRMTLVKATIKCGQEIIVEAEMKIALSDIDMSK